MDYLHEQADNPWYNCDLKDEDSFVLLLKVVNLTFFPNWSNGLFGTFTSDFQTNCIIIIEPMCQDNCECTIYECIYKNSILKRDESNPSLPLQERVFVYSQAFVQ